MSSVFSIESIPVIKSTRCGGHNVMIGSCKEQGVNLLMPKCA